MIKAIFFDLDGVLTTDLKGSLTMSKNLCKEFPNLSVEKVLECYREDIGPLTLGEKPLRDVLMRVCSVFSIPPSEELFLKITGNVPRNDAMFDLARELSGRYRLGIITDNSVERMDLLVEEMKLEPMFDPIVVSAAEHASKNDGTTTLFDAALEKAGCRPEEAIFIDNQKRNLVTPEKMGMKTYFHNDARNDMTALRAALKQMEPGILD